MKKSILILITLLTLMINVHPSAIAQEDEKNYPPLYVIATQLNGREWPTKKAEILALFDFGDEVFPTGNWSNDHEWLEVKGGESGTVWVNCRYVSERFMPFEVINENNGKVKIRSKPGGKGKVKGYIYHGKTIEIDQVIRGYGHCSKGWVDLEYLIEEIP